MNIKNFGTKSDKIKEFIKKVLEENPEEFQKIKPNKIKNADRFQNRIFGMVSYYGSLYFGKKNKNQ